MNQQITFPYAKPSISEEDRQAVHRSLTSPIITRGPLVKSFENELAAYCQAKYAVAFNSASTALAAAYHAAQTNVHDKIFTTPNTFVSTLSGGCNKGATPVFIDIDVNTGNISLEQLAHNLASPTTRGRPIIVPVHFAGIPVDMSKLSRSIRNPEAVVIEDASHVLGACYPDGRKVGSCYDSDMTIFSFHPAKNMTTGEGGAVLTNNAEYYDRLKRFRDNGIERDPAHFQGQPAPWKYEVHELTSGYHFTEFQAALGLSQLKRLDEFVKRRRELIEIYRELLQGIKHVTMLSSKKDAHAAFHLCVVQIDFAAYKTSRGEVMKRLQEAGIGTQVHYIPLYRHPYFKNLCGDIEEYFPNTEKYYARALSLPLYYELERKDIEYIVDHLRRCL